MKIKVQPRHGVQLWGYLDGLIELESGGYAVLDIKTLRPSDSPQKYALQLNVYAYCMEHPAEGEFTVSPVTRLGVLAFVPHRFAFRNTDSAALAGSLRWHPVKKDKAMIGKVMGEVIPVLRAEEPPPTPTCRWCQFYEWLGGTESILR